jgi:hypothetical protein
MANLDGFLRNRRSSTILAHPVSHETNHFMRESFDAFGPVEVKGPAVHGLLQATFSSQST